MEPIKPKLPKEAVQLYNEFIHGGMSRRDFASRVQQFAVGGLTAAAIVQALMPNYALGQQVATNDNRIKASYETIPSPQGNGYIRGYLVRPMGDRTGPVRAEGKVSHPGRQVATSEGRLTDTTGKLLAHATTTCLVFDI